MDDGNLKVRVTEVLSSTSVLGQALNHHTVHEMSLVHVPHAYRCGVVRGGLRGLTWLFLLRSRSG